MILQSHDRCFFILDLNLIALIFNLKQSIPCDFMCENRVRIEKQLIMEWYTNSLAN